MRAQKMEAVGRLTGGMAHDFNNLLTVIGGNLELMTSKLTDDTKLKKRVDAVLRASGKGAELTERLLAFSHRPGAFFGCGQREHPDRDEKCRVRCRLCRPQSRCKPGPHVLIAVSDNGTGIDSDVLDRVFEPFCSTEETGKSTGLVLNMVYGFVRQLGGSIGIYGEPGHGTIARIFLPRADADIAETQSSLVGPAVVSGNAEVILLVEDNEDVAETAIAMLEELSYRVLQAIGCGLGPHHSGQ